MKRKAVRPSSYAPGAAQDFEFGADEPVFTSGVVSRLLAIPVWVLKQLDRENIVRPPRQKGRSRLYSRKELCRLQHVWYYMSECRVNVQGVKVILQMESAGGGERE